MIGDILLVLLGLAVLLVGGDLLARGAISIAAALRAPPALIGLTVVAFGASAPEFAIAADAALRDADGLALGNIVGSNIANLLLAIGLTALVRPLAATAPGLRLDAAFLAAATGCFLLIAYGAGELGLAASAAFGGGLAVYVVAAILRARRRGASADAGFDAAAAHAGRGAADNAAAMMFLICGLVGLPIGAHFLVSGGKALAGAVGVRAEVIGLSVVSIGTALPELATLVAAARRRAADLAAGGIIGSCIFNLLAAGGIVGVLGGAAFSPAARVTELPVLAASTLVVVACVMARRGVSRLAGAALATVYGVFVVALYAGS